MCLLEKIVKSILKGRFARISPFEAPQQATLEPHLNGKADSLPHIQTMTILSIVNMTRTECAIAQLLQTKKIKSSISYIGYNIESSDGGFIKGNGQRVKIRHIHDDVKDTNLILRLEVNELDKLT